MEYMRLACLLQILTLIKLFRVLDNHGVWLQIPWDVESFTFI